MKDDVSIRITFSKRGKIAAQEIIDFIEENFDNISFQIPRIGNNPKYLPGGKNYDEQQGEFMLSYSRCRIKKYMPLLPKKKSVNK